MYASQSFSKELSVFMNEHVAIETKNGEQVEGTLRAYDPETMSIILENAFVSESEYKRLMLSGSNIAKIYLKEKRVDMKELADMLEESFPNLVEYRKDLGVILVMNRIRVTEDGVEGEQGPATKRVRKIYEQFMQGRPQSE